jgi:hypothetical protein
MKYLVLFLLATAPQLYAFDQNALVGEWIVESERNILGEGYERRLLFSIDEKKLHLAFKTKYFGRAGAADDLKEPVLKGPYPVIQIDEDELIYVNGNRQLHITFRLSEQGALEWGALVSKDNKKWRYAREEPSALLGSNGGNGVRGGQAQWTFLSDPFQVPVGEAEIPGIQKGRAFYIYEKLPSYETGKEPVPAIRVMTRNEDKTLSEQFRLIWGDWGTPHMRGTFSLGINLHILKTSICHRVEATD